MLCSDWALSTSASKDQLGPETIDYAWVLGGKQDFRKLPHDKILLVKTAVFS